jgi:hypothetical protein
MNYQTKQISFFALFLLIDILIILLLVYYFDLGEKAIEEGVIVAVIVIFGLIMFIFYGLFIEVTETQIKLKYGIGLIRRSIEINDIDTVECVRNKWWYGWGIRLTPHGWLWNISGLDAVEIKYKDTDRKFRIGTNDSNKLKAEIDKRLLRMSKKR